MILPPLCFPIWLKYSRISFFPGRQDSVNGSFADVQLAGDVAFCFAFRRESDDFFTQVIRHRLAAFVLAGQFGLVMVK